MEANILDFVNSSSPYLSNTLTLFILLNPLLMETFGRSIPHVYITQKFTYLVPIYLLCSHL